MTTTPRPYRVAVLGGGHRYFKTTKNAIAFARTQARQAWNDKWWTVWDRRTDTLSCRVNRVGDVDWRQAGGDRLGNRVRQEGCDRCLDCGCKYWENDRCIDCGGQEVRKEED
jgi:hypothetical protein